MLERAERASHIDPPASSYAIMHRASPYCGENPGPGKDVHGELDPTPGIREQPGSKAERLKTSTSRPLCPPKVGITTMRCEFGLVLAAAAEPTLADGITRLLAFAEKLHVG